MPKINGKYARSKWEYEMYQKLRDHLPKGATIEYEADRIPYVIQYEYIPDFTIKFKDGRKLFIETKGNGRAFDGHDRQKMVHMRDQNPDCDVRIIFFSDGRIGGSKQRKDGSYYKQSHWATKNNFLFTVKEIDKGWFE